MKQAGLLLLLDYHFSDTWADPEHQSKPAAWQNSSFTNLLQQLRSYSSNSIATFKRAGALPEYVQLGNEITSGLLWPDGRVGGSFDTAEQWLNLISPEPHLRLMARLHFCTICAKEYRPGRR